jgi:hypothetical protein
MSKEQIMSLEGNSEADLRALLELARQEQDYSLQLRICQALLPFEERPCLALTAIKELEQLIDQD